MIDSQWLDWCEFYAQGSMILKPASSGTVELRSNSVYDPPIIDPKYGPMSYALTCTPAKSALPVIFPTRAICMDSSRQLALFFVSRAQLRSRMPLICVTCRRRRKTRTFTGQGMRIRTKCDLKCPARMVSMLTDPDFVFSMYLQISDEEIKKFIRRCGQSAYHPVSPPHMQCAIAATTRDS